jgi:hypothetical protein
VAHLQIYQFRSKILLKILTLYLKDTHSNLIIWMDLFRKKKNHSKLY